MEKLLIIGAVQSVSRDLKSGLEGCYLIYEGTDRAHAMELFQRQAPKVVILDLDPLRGPGGTKANAEEAAQGFRCLSWMIEKRPAAKVVVLVGNRERGCRAVGAGAYDFCRKPVKLDELKMIIARALHLIRLEEQSTRLKEALERSDASIEGIVGQCTAMHELLSKVQKVADPEGGLLETGEGGMRERAQQAETTAAAAAPGESAGRHLCQGGEGASPVYLARELALPTEHLTLREVRDRVEKAMVGAAIGNCSGNMARASELLGVSRPALYDLMKKHGLFKPAARQ